jgi:hypothetical protein
MFEDLMTGLDEVESYLSGERDRFMVHVSADINVIEALKPQDAEE